MKKFKIIIFLYRSRDAHKPVGSTMFDEKKKHVSDQCCTMIKTKTRWKLKRWLGRQMNTIMIRERCVRVIRTGATEPLRSTACLFCFLLRSMIATEEFRFATRIYSRKHFSVGHAAFFSLLLIKFGFAKMIKCPLFSAFFHPKLISKCYSASNKRQLMTSLQCFFFSFKLELIFYIRKCLRCISRILTKLDAQFSEGPWIMRTMKGLVIQIESNKITDNYPDLLHDFKNRKINLMSAHGHRFSIAKWSRWQFSCKKIWDEDDLKAASEVNIEERWHCSSNLINEPISRPSEENRWEMQGNYCKSLWIMHDFSFLMMCWRLQLSLFPSHIIFRFSYWTKRYMRCITRTLIFFSLHSSIFNNGHIKRVQCIEFAKI